MSIPTLFQTSPKIHGLRGDNARVTAIEDRVLIRAVDSMAEEATTVAFKADQARELAAAIIAAADLAEGGRA